jgi:mRNA interferase RelE/StbE
MDKRILNIVPTGRAELIDLPATVRRTVQEHCRRIEEGYLGDVKPLRGYPGLFRKRVGDYRIIYVERGRVIQILAVGHRATIYDKLDVLPDADDWPQLDASAPTSARSAQTSYLTKEQLQNWDIPVAFHMGLSSCQSDDDLLLAVV